MAYSSKILNSDFKNKHVVIFGLGNYENGSGISSAKFFISHGARVLITDKKSEKDLSKPIVEIKKFAKKYKNQPVFVLGEHNENDFKNADIIVRNPGVPANNKFLKIARDAGAEIHTDVSLFLKLLQATSYKLQANVVGITGTRGKSTTSALLAHILRKSGYKVFLGGNMGYSPLNFLDKLQTMNSDKTAIILELSSWLVESLEDYRISPHYALVTNIYPDHLNTYVSMKEYVAAKEIVFKYQKKSDVLVLNKDNDYTRAMAKKAGSRVIWFSRNNAELRRISRGTTQNPVLIGGHNLENIAAARAVARALGVGDEKILRAVRTFKGLPGRLELVRIWRGVKFYNDTTSTMPEATVAALRALTGIRNHELGIKNIILIAGGMDKKLNYCSLAQEIPKYIKALILFNGSASDKSLEELRIRNQELGNRANPQKKHNSLFLIHDSVATMREAVRLAWKSAKRGDIILLSPGAASFNMFKNEFDRGAQFVKLVKKLK